MSALQPAPPGNVLLASLDPDTLARIRKKLTSVALSGRQVLHQLDGPIDHVYFLVCGMVSMVTDIGGDQLAEVGVVGREGAVGMGLVADVCTSFSQSMVQMPGTAWRMAAQDFRQEISESPPFRRMLLRYSEAFQAQVMQTAACNGRHELEKRLARWLLMCHDRQEGDMLPLTQEFVAMMLGVHRPRISVAAGLMQDAGIIKYRAGRITVLDRQGLEAASCGCYGKVHRRFACLASPARPDG